MKFSPVYMYLMLWYCALLPYVVFIVWPLDIFTWSRWLGRKAPNAYTVICTCFTNYFRLKKSISKWADVQLFAYLMFRRYCTNNCLTLIPPELSVAKGHVCLDKNRCLNNLPLTKEELNSACCTAVSIKTRQTVFFGALYMSHRSLTLLAFELAANYSSCTLHVTAMKTVN